MGYIHSVPVNENLSLYGVYEPEDIEEIFKAINILQNVSECDDIISPLVQKLEKYFENVKSKDNSKTIGDLIYYTNGLIMDKKTFNKVIATPWNSNDVILEKTVKKGYKKPLVNYNEIGGWFNHAWMCQVKLHEGVRFRKSFEFVKMLKQLEATILMPPADRHLLKLDIYELFRSYCDIKSFLNQGCYLSEKDITSIIDIYKLYYDSNYNYNSYWHFSNALYKALQQYFDSINVVNNPNGLYIFDSEVLFEELKKIRTIDNHIYNYDLSKLESISFVEVMKKFYQELYSIQDKNFREILIKTKIIEEGYIFMKEEDDNGET